MVIGTVTGNVVSTRKNESLLGSKLLVVRLFEMMGAGTIVAVDNVGAGIGDYVLVATGSAARVQNPGAPIDALIVGIIDDPDRLSDVK